MESEQDFNSSKGDKACEYYIPPSFWGFFVLDKISPLYCLLIILEINIASSKFITEGNLHPF